MAAADNALEMLGKCGVAMFFLICAYLFLCKVSAAEARRQTIDFCVLLRNRVARLVPLYVAAMTLAVGVVGLWGEKFVLHQGPAATAVELVQSYSFSFLGEPAFNASFLAFAAISVSWSLRYECPRAGTALPIRQ